MCVFDIVGIHFKLLLINGLNINKKKYLCLYVNIYIFFNEILKILLDIHVLININESKITF